MPFADAFEIASLIDHTLLKPEATEGDVSAVCRQALDFRFASVCVNPYWVQLVQAQLAGSPVRTCAVIGFPLGANKTSSKVSEARLATQEGAKEIDMVINIGALRSGIACVAEIAEVAQVVHSTGAILKVIIETCLLTDQQKMQACEAAQQAGADFVKTSTGFSSGGATEEDVALMRRAVGSKMGVKASGGVRTLESLIRMVQAGANRIGSSSGVQIIAEFQGGHSGAGDGGSY